MKKFFAVLLCLSLFVGCKGVDLNDESKNPTSNKVETQETAIAKAEKSEDLMESMRSYSNSAVLDFTQDYSLPLDSIKYNYDDEEGNHVFDLEHRSEMAHFATYVNDKYKEGKHIRTTKKGDPLTETVLKGMDKIFDRAVEDFEKQYPGEENVHFKSWSLYQNDEKKYVFHGLVVSETEHIWDVYYDLESDLGMM